MTAAEELRQVRLVLAGDRNAFGPIVEANQDHVYRLVLRLTGNEQDAMDVTQEAFWKAYRELGSFRGDCRLGVWLYRIAYNKALDFLRSRQRRPTVSLEADTEDGDTETMAIPDARYDPAAIYEQKELAESLREAMASLSPEHRTILELRELGGLSYEEIGTQLGLNPGTVKSRLNRAREQAAEFLRKHGTFPSAGRQKGKGGAGNAV